MQQRRPINPILATEIGATQQKTQVPPQQQQDVECCDTKIWLWDGDEYEEFQSDYLNQIFPYKLNKNTMASNSKFIFHFLNSSLHYWVELAQEKEQQGKLGLKDLKFLQEILDTDQTDNYISFRRWGQQFMKKQQFLLNEQKQKDFQPPQGGQLIHEYQRNSEKYIVMKYTGDNKDFSEFKKRMQVLLLFYIDGVSFINEEVNTWVYYIIFKKSKITSLTSQDKEKFKYIFVGALSKYIFKLSSIKQRHRISQVFILPSHQKVGHGKQLLDLVYKISLENKNCFQMTTQIPSFEYQCLRDYKEAEMILDEKLFDLQNIPVIKNQEDIKAARQILLSKDNLRKIKQNLKLPGHQIQRIAFTLIFYKIVKQDDDMAKAHFQQYLRQKIIVNRSPFKTRSKLPHITFFGQSPQMKQFFLQKAKQDFLRNQTEIQDILNETIDGYYRVIGKLAKLKKI